MFVILYNLNDKIMYTKEEMEKCFEAGVKFARDMMNNPSNSEYIELMEKDKKRVKK